MTFQSKLRHKNNYLVNFAFFFSDKKNSDKSKDNLLNK